MTNPLHTFEREVRVLTKRFALVPNLVLRTVSSSERAELELFDGARVVARLVVHTSTTEPPPPATQPVLPGVSVAVPGVRPVLAVAPATEDEDGAALIELRATEARMRDLWRPDATVIDLGRGKGPWAAWSRAEDCHTWRTVVTRTEARTILAVVPDLTLTLLPARSPLPHHRVHRDDLVDCDGGRDDAPFYGEPGVVLDVTPVTVTDLVRMPGDTTVWCAIVRLDVDVTTGRAWCAPLDRAVVTEDDGHFRLSLWQPVTEEDGRWTVIPYEPKAPPKKAKKTATKKTAATTKAPPKKAPKAKKTAPPRRVWIRETAWDALDPATQAALTEPVTGSSIAWEGREGAITAVLPEGALLQSLAHLARSLDVTLFYGETPPPAEVAAVAPDVTVIYREKAHAFDHLAKRAEVACLILTDSNGTRENKRPKKRTEAQWTQDIGELLSGACILEIARLYSQRGVCLWDSRDGERP